MQDRLLEKAWLQAHGIPTTPFLAINALTDLPTAAEKT